ncbi:amidohydrolase family protein [Novosphingobium sp. 11B]
MHHDTSTTDFSRTQRPDEAWLALAVPEEPLFADMPIIDTHMHMWHHASGYRYFVEEHACDIAMSRRKVESTVYVECGSMYRADGPAILRSVGETEFAAGMGAVAASGKYTATKIAAGIVANADPAMGDAIAQVVEAHLEAANGRLRGIRTRAKWDADPVIGSGNVADRPGVLREPTFHEGLRVIAGHGLVFEASIFHPQMGDVVAMARAVPALSIVVIHCGSPLGYAGYRGRDAEVFSDWSRSMRDLAGCPNVTMKLGGMLMSLGNFDFRASTRPAGSKELAELWRPYLETAIEVLGPDRCMAASNFPVEKAGVPYDVLWNIYARIVEGYSDHERAAIFSDTARRVYRL